MFAFKRLSVIFFVLVILFVGSTQTFSIEPYSVQTIYFIPKDSEDKSESLDLGGIIKKIQSTYKNEMERHGFPNQTFRLETDNQGNIIVHKFRGKHNKEHYGGGTIGIVKDELAANGFNDKRTIYAIVMAGMDTVQVAAGGVGGAWANGGWFGNSDYFGYCISIEANQRKTERILAHEIGHTFGLWHIALYNPQGYIMGGGEKLAFHEARWLANYHYFKNDHSFSKSPIISNFFPPTAIISEKEHHVRFKIELSDNQGLYQVYLYQPNGNLVGWEFIEDKRNVSVIDVPRNLLSNDHTVVVQAMDTDGNWHWYTQRYKMPDKLPIIEDKIEPEEVTYKDYIENGKQTWDFEEHSKGWKVANGDWYLEDGFYKVGRGNIAEHSLVGQQDWKNYVIDTKVRIDDVHFAGVVFRAKSEKEYYTYYLNTLDQRNQLFKHSEGDWGNRQEIGWTWTVGGIHLQNDTWYDVSVEVFKNKFICYINGKKQLEIVDNSYETGKVGLWAWTTAASFNDFTVTKEQVEKQLKNNLSIDPLQKITILWGNIKQLN